MKENFTLLPQPRQIAVKEGSFSPTAKSAIQIKAEDPQRLLFTAEQLARTLQSLWRNHWQITASGPLQKERKSLVLTVDPHFQTHPQGYRILIQPEQIEILGQDPQGMFYGVQTFQQMIQQSEGKNVCPA